jgi:hypothetical protein
MSEEGEAVLTDAGADTLVGLNVAQMVVWSLSRR